MKLSLLVKNIEMISSNFEDAEITAITDNTNNVIPGCAFVCIEGARFDGHNAAAEMERGGAAVIIAQRDTGAKNQIIVENTRAAYCLLCAAFFGNPQRRLRMIGVTGTNGKTTSCFIMKEMLEAMGEKAGMIGTVKNMVGDEEYPSSLTTPDPWELFGLLDKMVEAGCTSCVMEVSSQALAQHRVEGIRFAAAIFTNLTRDHLDYHGSFENYTAAKAMLFKNADLAIINMDDEASAEMIKAADGDIITFSVKSDMADYTAKNLKLSSGGVEYVLVGKSKIGRARFCVPGTFSVYNSMGAAVCLCELGMPFEQTLESLSHSKGVPGRLEVIPTNTDYTVIIDYAHSPDGLENVLSAIREVIYGRIITVFGCGGDRDKTKRPLMGNVVAEKSDIAIVTSDNPRSEDPEKIIEDILEGMKKSRATVLVEPDRTTAIALALKKAKANDVVLLAGKGHETYQILNTGKIHFDEREKVAMLLKAQK